MEYPELDKLAKIKDKSQSIGAFLDWLQNEKHYRLAKWEKDDSIIPEDQLMPVSYDIQQLLAEYFDIDLNKIEEEKRAILEEQRKLNKGVKS